MNASLRRLIVAIAVFATLVLVGSLGYLALGRDKWSYGDCVYMTIITISTVGYTSSRSSRPSRRVPSRCFSS